ncbi:MAG: N(G),N(G)-dimethylarginine dimethylaminohydrolase [Pirellulaceae bacterium]|nr:MAG: N(G),N(G)-dimethylarginine dimethylaminohydrolase [Pirellulaceae bacterium]
MWIALTRPPSVRLAEGERTFVARQPIDIARALRQHADYCSVLERLGVQVVRLDKDDALADSVFIEDAAVVLDELAVIARFGVPSRQPETALVQSCLQQWLPTIPILPPGTLEGGDVLRVGRRLWVGRSLRTNAEGISQLRRTVEPLGYQVTEVPVQGCLHLKTACTALPSGQLLVQPEWIDVTCLPPGWLPVPDEEPWGANVLSIAGEVLVPAAHRRTARMLEENGYRVHRVEIDELAKAEAGVTCLALCWRLDRSPRR